MVKFAILNARMNIYRNISELPRLENAVVTIGSFDGVHLAHRKLIKQINQIASEVKGDPIVVTFNPHPRSIVFPNDKSLSLLTDLEEKIELLREAGTKNLFIVPFTVEFAQLSALEYIEKFLVNTLNTKYLVVGYDHKFGLARMGDFDLLKMYEKKGSFKVIEIEKQQIREIAISSTNIRKAISSNEIEKANELIGGYYNIRGKVVKGDGIGKTIGYPTANIKVDNKDKLLPNAGIYACYVKFGGKRYGGMLYIGNRPTIQNNGAKVVEVNIFDFNDNIYDEYLTIELIKHIRDDSKFDSLENLKSSLDNDRSATIDILNKEQSKSKSFNEVTIAILNFNGSKIIEDYLSSVVNHNSSYKVVVIDNCSTDNSIQIIQNKFPEVKIINLVKNHGFANGYNFGINEIDSEYIVFLNSDIKVTEQWIEPLIETIKSDETIACVQPKILSINNPESFEYAGASGGFLDSFGYPYCRGRVFEEIEVDSGQYDDVVEVFWTSGAAMMVKTELFKRIGGFDGDFFAHQEEIDFCWRVKRAGYKCMIDPRSVVYHLGGGTLGYENANKTFLNFKNNLLMLFKNIPFPKIIFVFLIRLILDGLAGLRFLFKGKFLNILSIIKAHFYIYIKMPEIILKRVHYNSLINKNRIGKENLTGQTPGLIILKYFLLGRKKFSQL